MRQRYSKIAPYVVGGGVLLQRGKIRPHGVFVQTLVGEGNGQVCKRSNIRRAQLQRSLVRMHCFDTFRRVGLSRTQFVPQRRVIGLQLDCGLESGDGVVKVGGDVVQHPYYRLARNKNEKICKHREQGKMGA